MHTIHAKRQRKLTKMKLFKSSLFAGHTKVCLIPWWCWLVTSNKGWKSEKIKLVSETLCHLSAREVTTAENTIAGNPIPGIMFLTPSNANHLLMCECHIQSREFCSFLDGTSTGKKFSQKKYRNRYRENLVPVPENSWEFGTGNGEFPAIFLFFGWYQYWYRKKIGPKKSTVPEQFGPGKKYQYRKILGTVTQNVTNGRIWYLGLCIWYLRVCIW